MFANYPTQVIRTVISYAVSWVVTFLLVHFAITVPSSTKDWLTATLTFLLGSLYYMVAAALEKRWPQAGILLGKPSRPVYAATTADGAYVVTTLGTAHADLSDRQLQELATAVTEPLAPEHVGEHLATSS